MARTSCLDRSSLRTAVGAAALISAVASAPAMPSNINTDAVYCWGENIGFLNLRDSGFPPTTNGVFISQLHLSGFIWAENVGHISVGDGTPGGTTGQYTNADGPDTGVNIDSSGDLFGFAWGENIGWVNFDTRAALGPTGQQARVDRNARRLFGYAWGENVGWINLDDARPAMTVACPADFSGDGVRTVDDVFIFIAQWFKGDTRCDIDHDGVVSIDDIFIFITIWFQGC
jgi:hypothetical protein